jgi:hypothetical protein
MSKFCNCSKELFIFNTHTHQHLKERRIFGDFVLIDGTLEGEHHCNYCDKPLIDFGTHIKRDNDNPPPTKEVKG